MVAILIAKPRTAQTMAVVTAAGNRINMYNSPPQFNYQHVTEFGTIERKGQKALTRRTAPGLATLSFTQRLSSRDYTKTIEGIAKRLTRLARDGTKVRFTNASPEFEQAHWWQIVSMEVIVTQRALNNQASRIELEWELVEAVNVTTKLSKIAPPPPPPPKKKIGVPAVRTHRVVRGNTLWGIAAQYLGNGARWPEIFRLNQSIIKNPHWIFPGQLFKIPAR